MSKNKSISNKSGLSWMMFVTLALLGLTQATGPSNASLVQLRKKRFTDQILILAQTADINKNNDKI